MWQRFTERARKAVFYAQEEAGILGENYVGTEHLLLGLVREDDSVAGRLLGQMDISRKRIREEVGALVQKGEGRLGQDMQLTPRAKRAIDLAYDEARQLNNNYIGTEHLLLCLIREEGGIASTVLAKVGVDLEKTRDEVRRLQEDKAADKTTQAAETPTDPKAAQKRALVDHLQGVLTALRANWTTGAGEAGEEAVAQIRSEDVAIVSVAYTLLQYAVSASDRRVFVEPSRYANELLQYFNGDELKLALPRTLYLPLLARLKAMAQTPPGPERVLRQANVVVQYGDREYDISLGFVPTEQGDTIVIHSAEPVQADME